MIKQLLKKVLIIYLVVIACVFTPTYKAYAVSAGGWAFSSFDVAKSLVTAMKNGATATAAVAKSPITSKIAKGILGGAVAGAAIPLAISQISGIALSAVDWLLDPANNSIKYRKKGGDVITGIQVEGGSYPVVATEMEACQAYYLGTGSTCVSYNIVNDYYIEGCATTKTDPTPYCTTVGYYVKQPNNWKSVGIPTVANKIYDNAKTDSNSRSVVDNAVTEYVNEGSADTALNNAKADADATHNCGTGTYWSGSACVATPSTPSTPTTPDVPFDPSGIIDAIQSVFDAVQSVFSAVMSLPDVINSAIDKVIDAIASITDVINTAIDDLLVDIKDFFQPVIDSFTDFVDWVKSEPTPENPTKPDVTTLPTPQTDSVNISFDGGCPAPKVIAWSLAGQNVDITISYTPICDTATLLNPIIKLAASLGAVFIIAGIRRGDDG